jgi:hypothetical protein
LCFAAMPSSPPSVVGRSRRSTWPRFAGLSPPRTLVDLQEPSIVRTVLDVIARRFDGMPAAANAVRRKRGVFHHMMETAVELKELPSNPLKPVKWKPPKAAASVDPHTVVNPVQARQLLTAVTTVGRSRGPRLAALFACMYYACMYYAALRPEEASGLRLKTLKHRRAAQVRHRIRYGEFLAGSCRYRGTGAPTECCQSQRSGHEGEPISQGVLLLHGITEHVSPQRG